MLQKPIRMPASEGPSTRELLNEMAFSETALAMYRSPASWGASDCRAGWLNDWVGQAVSKPALCHLLEPLTDLGGEGTRPQVPIVADGKGSKGVGQIALNGS